LLTHGDRAATLKTIVRANPLTSGRADGTITELRRIESARRTSRPVIEPRNAIAGDAGSDRMSDHVNPFFDPPDSFDFDAGPERSVEHFDSGHEPQMLELFLGEDIEVVQDDVDLEVDVDAIDLDDAGLAEALEELDRSGGIPL
jgi:hypothetical protein